MVNMHTLGTIRAFHTPNYIVIVTAEEEPDLDLSWDETGETAAKLDTGDLVAFCAHVKVIHTPTGSVLGEDYLGNCVYEDFDAFMVKGGYFVQMVREAIGNARQNYGRLLLGKLHEA